MLLVFRSIQGAGGGGIVVMTEIIVCDMIPLRLRGEWFGLLSGMYAIGTVLGPILGGVFAQHVTWVSIPPFSHGVLDSDYSSAGCFISIFPASV